MNEKKTAEGMLKEYADNSYINSGSLGGSFNGLDRIPFVVWPSVVKIMQKYAAQETAALCEENERLKEAVKELIPIAERLQAIITLMWSIAENQEVSDSINHTVQNAKRLLQNQSGRAN